MLKESRISSRILWRTNPNAHALVFGGALPPTAQFPPQIHSQCNVHSAFNGAGGRRTDSAAAYTYSQLYTHRFCLCQQHLDGTSLRRQRAADYELSGTDAESRV